ncbi:hypothetical protein CRUP_009600 [Coryphaenoides rupestris]|nr:hypothetical protein CRUP_009600 [Coryphaenoides rupestris]
MVRLVLVVNQEPEVYQGSLASQAQLVCLLMVNQGLLASEAPQVHVGTQDLREALAILAWENQDQMDCQASQAPKVMWESQGTKEKQERLELQDCRVNQGLQDLGRLV